MFVSCEHPPLAAPLTTALRQRGAEIRASPTPDDPRWKDWYGAGCLNELQPCDRFVAVVTDGYDGSTWMAHEIHVATGLQAEQGRPTVFLFRSDPRALAVGFHRYEVQAIDLPAELEAAATRIVAPRT